MFYIENTRAKKLNASNIEVFTKMKARRKDFKQGCNSFFSGFWYYLDFLEKPKKAVIPFFLNFPIKKSK